MPHFIRLLGPWSIQPVAEPDDRGTVVFTRRFQCSAGLAASSRVWLCIEDVTWKAMVKLNGLSLGEIVSSQAGKEATGARCPARFDITAAIQPRNLLTITLESPTVDENGKPRFSNGQANGHMGLVRLEVE